MAKKKRATGMRIGRRLATHDSYYPDRGPVRSSLHASRLTEHMRNGVYDEAYDDLDIELFNWLYEPLYEQLQSCAALRLSRYW